MSINPTPPPVTATTLRSALGPGYQFGGARDYMLRVISLPRAIH